MAVHRITVHIVGEQEAWDLAARLKRAGDGRLQDKLRDAVRDANRGVPAKLRLSAIAHLPKRNGLAGAVARSRIRVRPLAAGVGIYASHQYDIAGLDNGLNIHPLFGNKRHWYLQPVRPGWFQSVVDGQRGESRRAVERAVESFIV